MTRQKLPLIALVTLGLSGCGGGGGLNYWLYPEPHLGAAEEAVFVAYESHQVQSIDGEETAALCWGMVRQQQAYRPRDRPCRLHIRTGEHSVFLHPNARTAGRVEVTFTALPGRMYGLDWSSCSGSLDRVRQSCRVEVVEIGTVEGDG